MGGICVYMHRSRRSPRRDYPLHTVHINYSLCICTLPGNLPCSLPGNQASVYSMDVPYCGTVMARWSLPVRLLASNHLLWSLPVNHSVYQSLSNRTVQTHRGRVWSLPVNHIFAGQSPYTRSTFRGMTTMLLTSTAFSLDTMSSEQ